MDQIPAFGTSIPQTVLPTRNTYKPLLAAQASKIKSTKRETFSYGAHPRQELDIYTSSHLPNVNPNESSTKPISTPTKTTVFLFLYGGGLVRGDKLFTNDFDSLVHANVGYFFTEKLNCKVAIMDYRLVGQGAKFPSGGEDVQLAVEWLIDHFTSGTASSPESSRSLDLYIMGNSAGGIHLTTFLLAPQFASTREKIWSTTANQTHLTRTRTRLKGIILLSVPYDFEQADPTRSDVLRAYFGNRLREDSPLGLLKAFKKTNSAEEVQNLKNLPVLVLTGSLDPEDEILAPHRVFVEELLAVGGGGSGSGGGNDHVESNLVEETMLGHNHISPVLALGTGLEDEEAWGRIVVDFVVDCSRK